MSDNDSVFVRPRCFRASEIAEQDIEPLWSGRFYIGELSIVAGYGGTAKTTLACEMAARMTTGRKWPDGAENPGGEALFLTAEDSISKTLVPRLKCAGADMSKVHFFGVEFVEVAADGETTAGEKMFSLVTDITALDQYLEENPGIRLFVVDPIASFLGQDVDSHVNADVRSALAPLWKVAGERRVCVVGIHHLNKVSGGAAINRASGSGAFVNAPRSAWLISKDKDDSDRRIMSCIKNNLGPDGPDTALAYRLVPAVERTSIRVLEWDTAPVTMSADDALDPGNRGQGAPKTDAATEWLRQTLADGPLSSDMIFRTGELVGFKERTLWRAKAKLGIKARKRGIDKGWEWVP